VVSIWERANQQDIRQMVCFTCDRFKDWKWKTI